MIELGIVIACIFLILLLPCGLYGAYGPDGVIAELFIGPFKINLLKKNTKKKKKKSTTSVKEKRAENTTRKRKLSDFLPLLQLVLDFLSDFKRKLVIQDLQLNLTLAGEDPFDLSVNYGRIWLAVGNFLPLLESRFTIRNRKIDINCDFNADETVVVASIDLRLRIVTLLHMVLHHGTRILTKYLTITKNIKDGVAS